MNEIQAPADELSVMSYNIWVGLNEADELARQVDLIQSIDPATDTSGFEVLLTTTDFRGIYIADVTGAVSEPLADPLVRQAMQYAIDREAITDALYGDSGQISYSTPFATGQLGYSDSLASTFPYDPEKAKELLSDAGYPDGFAVKTMVVPFMYGDGAQAIAGQLSEVGITLELEDHAEDFFDQLTSGDWPMITFNFSIGTNPIRTYEGLSDPNGFWNTLHSVSPEIPGLLGDLNAVCSELDLDDCDALRAMTLAMWTAMAQWSA